MPTLPKIFRPVTETHLFFIWPYLHLSPDYTALASDLVIQFSALSHSHISEINKENNDRGLVIGYIGPVKHIF